MKAIRTFWNDGVSLKMHSTFIPEDDSLDLLGSIDIVADVCPTVPGDSISGDVIRMTIEDFEIPLDLRIQEMQHFINVLKLMYYGVHVYVYTP